jgi:hypothetical protein
MYMGLYKVVVVFEHKVNSFDPFESAVVGYLDTHAIPKEKKFLYLFCNYNRIHVFHMVRYVGKPTVGEVVPVYR